MEKPHARKPPRLFENGIPAGRLDPVHNIRVLGDSCSYCPGIGDYHDGSCARNKESNKKWLDCKKRLQEAGNSGLAQKPVRRKMKGKEAEVGRSRVDAGDGLATWVASGAQSM